MKTNSIVVVALLAMLWGCDSKEKMALRATVDSLSMEVQNHDELLLSMQQIGTLIDSIDINRNLLRTSMLEGTSYTAYSERLQEINAYVKQTSERINSLEKKVANQSSGYALTIKKLRADLETSSLQLVALQQEVEKVRNDNNLLVTTVASKDSVLQQQTELIKMKEQNITSLDSRIVEINTEAKVKQADLLFAQAEAMELAASRTKLAPRKKKDTKREALELYKMSLSLGKAEAETKIASLEESI